MHTTVNIIFPKYNIFNNGLFVITCKATVCRTAQNTGLHELKFTESNYPKHWSPGIIWACYSGGVALNVKHKAVRLWPEVSASTLCLPSAVLRGNQPLRGSGARRERRLLSPRASIACIGCAGPRLSCANGSSLAEWQVWTRARKRRVGNRETPAQRETISKQ